MHRLINHCLKLDCSWRRCIDEWCNRWRSRVVTTQCKFVSLNAIIVLIANFQCYKYILDLSRLWHTTEDRNWFFYLKKKFNIFWKMQTRSFQHSFYFHFFSFVKNFIFFSSTRRGSQVSAETRATRQPSQRRDATTYTDRACSATWSPAWRQERLHWSCPMAQQTKHDRDSSDNKRCSLLDTPRASAGVSSRPLKKKYFITKKNYTWFSIEFYQLSCNTLSTMSK